VDDDPGRAHDRMAAALDRLYGYFGLGDMTPVSVFGAPDACARGLRDVAAAGAGLILVNPLFDDEDQMERLAGEVIPQLS
jgi:alkanesulfonate monooxygenase SsuD/methylene tetrahydromethanopterin reductase-like flavin-dependent oxidoreductase (luciferase family)